MYTTILLAAALQNWELWSAEIMFDETVAATQL